MANRLHPVTAASIGHDAATVRRVLFWQAREKAAHRQDRWAERVEDGWGAWGTLYLGDDDRMLGFVQYGPSDHFQRAQPCPQGRRRTTVS